jgi:hypothetical protein
VFDVRRGNEVGMRFGTGLEISSRGAQYRYPSLREEIPDTGGGRYPQYPKGILESILAEIPVSKTSIGPSILDTVLDTGRSSVRDGLPTQLSLDFRNPTTRQHGSKPDTLWTRGTSSPSSPRKLLSRLNLRMV